jgi:hypothetical protein
MASLMEISPLDGLVPDVLVPDVVPLLLEPCPLPDRVLLLVPVMAPPPPKEYAP